MPNHSELDALYNSLEKACTGDYVLSRSERYITVHEDDLHAFVRQFETEREKLKARFVEVFHADAQKILHGEATALEKALTAHARLQAERDRLGAALTRANAILASEADEKTALDARATVAESACELHERIAKSMGVRLNDCEAQIQRLTTCEFHGEHTGETTGCCAHRQRSDHAEYDEPDVQAGARPRRSGERCGRPRRKPGRNPGRWSLHERGDSRGCAGGDPSEHAERDVHSKGPTQLALPQNFNGAANVTVELWVSTGNTNADAASFTVETSWDGGALVSDAATDGSPSGTIHKITATILAADIPDAASFLTLILTLGTHATDLISLHAARVSGKVALATS